MTEEMYDGVPIKPGRYATIATGSIIDRAYRIADSDTKKKVLDVLKHIIADLIMEDLSNKG